MAFSATTVSAGQGLGVITATGGLQQPHAVSFDLEGMPELPFNARSTGFTRQTMLQVVIIATTAQNLR
jgi:hypothetical protein